MRGPYLTKEKRNKIMLMKLKAYFDNNGHLKTNELLNINIWVTPLWLTLAGMWLVSKGPVHVGKIVSHEGCHC